MAKTLFANCECITWCRVPDEGNGGRYPMSDHHPNCAEFKPERYVVLKADPTGPGCVCEPKAAEQMIADAEKPYIVSDVMLTREQYERMREFDGF